MVERTNINLDMDLVGQAARELGTSRTTDTVHEALRDVVARSSRPARPARLRGPHPRGARGGAPAGRAHRLTELADTSAWGWSRKAAFPDLRREFDAALVDGELSTCDMVRLELLYSARERARARRHPR